MSNLRNELNELKRIAPDFGRAILLIGGAWVVIVAMWAIFGN